MSIEPADIYAQLRAMREDLTRMQGRVTEITNLLNELNLPSTPEHRCPTCDVKLRGPLSLAEHLYTSHGGPIPAHYLAAEHAAGLT